VSAAFGNGIIGNIKSRPVGIAGGMWSSSKRTVYIREGSKKTVNSINSMKRRNP
jgi:hypothetical protein